MALGYRTVFTVRSRRDEVIPIVRGQLYAWLRHKHLDADRGEVGRRVLLAPHAVLTMQELDGGDESTTFRARLEESTRAGVWTSTVTAHVPGDGHRDPWVWIDIDAPEGHAWTGRPRIAADVLGVVDAFDGGTSLSAVPEVVTADETADLVAVLRDPGRRRLVFVAGSDEQMPIQRWTQLLTNLLRETVGLASTYVLDAEATRLLATALGEKFAVAPGTVRTFAPRVDINDPDDALRHRILGTRRIVHANAQSIARLLGEPARALVTVQPLPRAVSRVNHLLERQLDELALGVSSALATPARPAAQPNAVPAVEDSRAEAAASEPAGEVEPVSELEPTLVPETDTYLALIQAIHDVLGSAEPSVDAVAHLGALARLGQDSSRRIAEVSQRLANVRAQLGSVEEQRDDLSQRHEDEQLEHAATAAALRRAEAEVRHLRDLFLRNAPQVDIWTPAPEDLVPESFDDLLFLVDDLPGLDTSGLDREITLNLAAYDPMGVWAGKTWEVLLSLSDYARAKADGKCDRDVDGYLRNTPAGYRTYPANRHARDESEDVRNNTQFANRRRFPVPETVLPGGTVFMGAHFKIAQYGLVSPRLHYYDATSVDGRIYVGYIGPHLPTKQTN